jgi:hypothetical protein
VSPVVRRASALCFFAAAFAAAEDKTVPSPAAAPAPTPPAVAAPEAAPPAPALTPVAKPAGDQRPGVIGAAASLFAGYDSNIILEPDHSPTATDKSGAAFGGDVKGTLRLVDREGYGLWSSGSHAEKLAFSLSGGVRDYPTHAEADQWRAGAQLTGHERRAFADPGFVLGYNHYDIDHKSAADAANADIYASRISPGYRDVDIALVGGEYLRYPIDPDKTGELAMLGYRHWLLLRPSDIHRRIELGLTGSLYHAKATFESWYGIGPSASAVWRIGTGQRLGTIDLSGAASYEWRKYGSSAGVTEKQGLSGASVGADAWTCSHSSAGIYVAYGHRESNFPTDTYSRFQTGVRIAALW